MSIYNGGTDNDRYVLGLGGGVNSITDSGGTADVLDLRILSSKGFSLYRDGTALKIRDTNGDLSTVNNFWAASTGAMAGAGRLELADFKNQDNNTVTTFNIALGTTGSAGNDLIVGTVGNDTLSGEAGNDRLQGDVGNDTLIGGAGNDFLSGGAGNDILNGGTDNDRYVLGLGGGVNSITDSGGTADVLDLRILSSKGFSLYRDGTALKIRDTNGDLSTVNNFWAASTGAMAGAGRLELADFKNQDNNTVTTFNIALGTTGSAGNDLIVGTVGNDTLSGEAGNDRLQGDVGNDTLIGGAGNDFLSGGAGNDILNGGTDNDRYVLGLGGGVNSITDSGGTADVLDLRILSSKGFSLYRDGTALKIRDTNGDLSTVNNFWAASTGAMAGAGRLELADFKNQDNNTVTTFNIALGTTGSAGNDLIVGTVGNDTLSGEAGNDRLQGDVGNDTLIGGAGNDFLSGGAGNDILNGGTDNDRYVLGLGGGVNSITDSGGTADVLDLRILSSKGFSLYRDGTALKIRDTNGDLSTVNNFWAASTGAMAGAGRLELADFKNQDNNTVTTFNIALGTTGSAGNDLIVGTVGNDTLSGEAGNDRLQGDVGNDTLIGGAGNDFLSGGAGNDILNGGTDNDRYVLGLGGGVNSITDSGGTADVLDLRILSSKGFSLYRDGTALKIRDTNGDLSTVNNFWAASTGAMAGAGRLELADFKNQDNNTVTTFNIALGTTGSAGNDLIVGTVGNDTLSGEAGNDRLQGDVGNDTLIGGAGNDFLSGGAGNDILNGGTDNDRYVLGLGGGVNSITDSGGTADVLDLRILSSKGFSLYRDGTALKIRDTNGDLSTVNNFWAASTGAMAGAGRLELADFKNQDNNTVLNYKISLGLYGGDENDLVVGTTFGDYMMGWKGNDLLQGGDSNDNLYGGLGNDILIGGSGSDMFVFDTTLSATLNVDQITDFNVGSDIVVLSSTVMTGLIAINGNLTSDMFKAGFNSDAADASDRIIYNKSTGALFYDVDGTGASAAVQIAVIGVNLSLTNADFAVI